MFDHKQHLMKCQTDILLQKYCAKIIFKDIDTFSEEEDLYYNILGIFYIPITYLIELDEQYFYVSTHGNFKKQKDNDYLLLLDLSFESPNA